MSDLIPTRDRIMALLSPPSQDVYLVVEDARWIKTEIERLRERESMSHERVLEQEIERLRAVLERIANPRDGEGYGEDLREMAREALSDRASYTKREVER